MTLNDKTYFYDVLCEWQTRFLSYWCPCRSKLPARSTMEGRTPDQLHQSMWQPLQSRTWSTTSRWEVFAEIPDLASTINIYTYWRSLQCSFFYLRLFVMKDCTESQIRISLRFFFHYLITKCKKIPSHLYMYKQANSILWCKINTYVHWSWNKAFLPNDIISSAPKEI